MGGLDQGRRPTPFRRLPACHRSVARVCVGLAVPASSLAVAIALSGCRQVRMAHAWTLGARARSVQQHLPRYWPSAQSETCRHASSHSRARAPSCSTTGVTALAVGLSLGLVAHRRLAMSGAPWAASRRLGRSGEGRRQLHVAGAGAEQTWPRIVTDTLRVPPTDEVGYRVLELENGLQVLLASDPTADTAGAALTVRCGTFQDTDERPGLAHFHEHMLFLGTEKYPAEDEYSKFLNEHGGDSNAFTMGEFTSYYFKVASPHLRDALDRFSQFFVAPNFDPSCVEREMSAVDSENTNYSTEDGWRILQIQKAIASSSHPFHRFDVGNLSTLGVDDPLSTRSELIEWNGKHYQAGAMKLVVTGRDSLETLQDTVVEQFSAVRRGGGMEQKYDTLPWTADKLGRIVYTVPLKENRALSVSWPLPPKTEHPFLKPELYLSHVLGHEGMGSLHDALNQRGWVDQLTAGPSQSFSDSQLFSVSMTLTPEGDENREEVLALLFEYVAMVRKAGPQEATFQELSAMQEIAFAYKEDSPAPDDFAVGTSAALFHYPAHEAIRGPFAVDEWNPNVVKEYLEFLQPERCIVFISSPGLAVEAGISGPGDVVGEEWKREKWYRAPYREEAISAAQLERWQQAGADSDSGLSLPQCNPFIPQDFSLRGSAKPSASRIPAEVISPTPISSEPLLRLWHKTDNAFGSPRVYMLAHAHMPAYEAGPETVTMMRLFCNVVNHDLNSYAYDASIAGLTYSLEYSDSLSISVGGFSDKLPELLQVLVSRLTEVLEQIEAAGDAERSGKDPERSQMLLECLEVQREILLVDYSNFTREEPWSVANYYASQIMMRNCWHLDEYVEILERPPSLSALAATVRPALEKMQMEVLVHGNASVEEAQSLTGILKDSLTSLGVQPLPEAPKREVTKIPLGPGTIFEYDLAQQNPAQENCCTQNIYQVGVGEEDLHRMACLVLACHIAGPSAYERLRTQEQLGYIVQAWCWTEAYVCGLSVLVQGARMSPAEVDLRIEAWLENFEKELEKMSDEDFATNVQAVISAQTQRYARMAQETAQHWSEIASRRFCFDRLARSVESLEALSKKDVVAFFSEYLAASATQRRKLSVRILGTSAGQARSEPEAPDGQVLGDLGAIRDFKAHCETYPAPEAAKVPA